jgi:hypothetical protein
VTPFVLAGCFVFVVTSSTHGSLVASQQAVRHEPGHAAQKERSTIMSETLCDCCNEQPAILKLTLTDLDGVVLDVLDDLPLGVTVREAALELLELARRGDQPRTTVA